MNENTVEAAAEHWRRADPEAIHPTWQDAVAWAESGRAAASDVAAAVRRYGFNVADLTILDYGCGAGRLTGPLSRLFDRVVAADTNADYLAHDRFPTASNVHPVHIDDPDDPAASFDLDAVDVDVVLCHNLMIHFDWYDAAVMLGRFAEWARYLVVVQLPLYDEPRRPGGWTNVGVWTPAMFEVAAGAAGLGILEMHPNPGVFSYDRPGPNHAAHHVLGV